MNRIILAIFAPVLILTGILGFFIDSGLMSNTPHYNLFHIIFGLIGVIFILYKEIKYIIYFNLTFGLLDLYQAFASYFNLFPASIFLWKPMDDILHIMIGLGLVFAAIYGLNKEIKNESKS